jgi:hypothetical protein
MVAGPARGWPWWSGVLLAFGLAIIGAVIDILIHGEPRQVFDGGYFIGCVGAVCVIRRRSLFTTMVQPPLVFVVTVAITMLAFSGSTSGGLHGTLLAIATPLINGFLTMAVGTAVTLGVGVARIVLQRPPRTAGRSRTSSSRTSPAGSGRARPGGSRAAQSPAGAPRQNVGSPRQPRQPPRGDQERKGPRGQATPTGTASSGSREQGEHPAQERRRAEWERRSGRTQPPPERRPPEADRRRPRRDL